MPQLNLSEFFIKTLLNSSRCPKVLNKKNKPKLQELQLKINIYLTDRPFVRSNSHISKQTRTEKRNKNETKKACHIFQRAAICPGQR